MFWLGAIVSLCYVPGMTGAYIATQWPLLAVVLSFGLLRPGPLTALHWLGLLFIAYATIHVWFTPTPQASVFGLWLIYVMGMCLWFGTTLPEVRSLYAGLALGGAVSSLVSASQFFGLDLVSRVTDQPVGLYVNSVQHGTVLALLIVALASERMWLWALPLLPGVVLSGSRGAWLLLAVGLLGCYVRRLWVFAAVGAVGAFYLLTPLGSSDQIRLLIWSTAWHSLTWLGWGPGVFYTILLPKAGGGMFFPEYAHNDALQLAFEYGLGALLPCAIFAYALCRTECREWPVVLAFVAASCYSMPLYMPVASFVALVAVGRILRVYALARRDRSSRRFDFVPWQHRTDRASCSAVSVEPYHTAKG